MTKQFIENSLGSAYGILKTICDACFENTTLAIDSLTALANAEFEDILKLRGVFKENGRKYTTVTIAFNSITDSILNVEVMHFNNGKREFKCLIEESDENIIKTKLCAVIKLLK